MAPALGGGALACSCVRDAVQPLLLTLLPHSLPGVAHSAAHRERMQALPDTERREAAAAMVTQLMAAMGVALSDEEDDDDDEEAEEQ